MAGRGAPGRRDKKPAADQRNSAERERAAALVAQGMPFQMAMAVANGRLELNDALQRMAMQDNVDKLMVKHALSRALATQIAIGHARLDDVLRRRRQQKHREANVRRSCLDELHASRDEVTFAVHGKKKLTGCVAENGSYNILFDSGTGGEDVHKLQLKYGYRASDWKRVRKVLKTDKKRASAPKEPIPRPQDRYSVSDKRLFRYVDEGIEVTVTTLEGDVIKGVLRWFSRYELGLEIRGEIPVWVFRHAVDDIRS